jgi:predicted dehydrogenase
MKLRSARTVLGRSSRPVRFLLVGAGSMGSLRARALAATPGAQLVAVADIVRDRAERLAHACGARALADYQEALQPGTVDAVVVSTPVHVHEEVALASFAAGRAVLCEKPLSNSVASCRRMVAAAAREGCALAVGFHHRYFASFRSLKQIIDDHCLGRLDHLRVLGGHEGLRNFSAEWMYRSPLSGGGAMMDIGIHLTDLIRYLVGDITEVFGWTSNAVWRLDGSEDNALVLLRAASGVPVLYQATWSEWRGYRFRIDAYGERGMARASYGPMRTEIIEIDDRARRRRRVRRYAWINVREKLAGWQTTARQAFAAEIADFLRMMRGVPVPLADGVAGLRAVEVAHAVYKSNRCGLPLRVGGDVAEPESA